MDCCQNNSSLDNKSLEERNKVSWKTIIAVIIILGLLIISSFSMFSH